MYPFLLPSPSPGQAQHSYSPRYKPMPVALTIVADAIASRHTLGLTRLPEPLRELKSAIYLGATKTLRMLHSEML